MNVYIAAEQRIKDIQSLTKQLKRYESILITYKDNNQAIVGTLKSFDGRGSSWVNDFADLPLSDTTLEVMKSFLVKDIEKRVDELNKQLMIELQGSKVLEDMEDK